MILNNKILSVGCVAVALLCASPVNALGHAADVIPAITDISVTKGVFTLPERGATFRIKGADADALSSYLSQSVLGVSDAKGGKHADIDINILGRGDAESYTMDITPKGISVKAADEAGAFYAVQTLVQMTSDGRDRVVECCRISDKPRFGYRGLHFDVSRHFRSKEFLKKQIDAMAMMKMNNMHLHLTDGAGWRMEIESYPRLTEFAAWRPERSWQEWRNNGTKYCEQSDPRAQGGFYTKDDLREIVRYAADRHINVIPEIEMPGHSEEVLSAYPELSCSGRPYENADFCVGKEATFKFLEDVLSEVIDVFPSEYIHIGGDEAGKGAWRECPDCKARMERENLENVDQLQSYLIKRMERFINAKGRKIIGWDEILEGGVAPNATVMSWRGTEGGITALKSGHDVIMTPGSYCYIDYSQDAPFKEPVSIGGYTPLSKVYSYEPLEPGLTEADASHLLGVQANLWSEYVTEDSHAEHMYYPRAYAIAEIGWSRPGKNYGDFHRRSLAMNDLMRERGYAVFDLANEYGERKESLDSVSHAGAGAKVIYNLPYHSKYPGGGDTTLTDGLRGGWNNNDGRWQGTLDDVDLTVDLGRVMPVHYIGAAFFHSEGAWIHLPEKVIISVSDDGETFREAGTVWCDVDPAYPKIMVKDYGVAVNTDARYVRLHAVKNPRPGAWLFTDEIIIN